MAQAGQYRLPADLLRYLMAAVPFHYWEDIAASFSWRTWQAYCEYRYRLDFAQVSHFQSPNIINTELFTKVATIAGDVSWQGQVYLRQQIYEAYLVKSKDPVSDLLFAQYAIYYGKFKSSSLLLLLMESGSTRKLLYYLFYGGNHFHDDDIFRYRHFTATPQAQLLMKYLSDESFRDDGLWFLLNGIAGRYIDKTDMTLYAAGLQINQDLRGDYKDDMNHFQNLIYPRDWNEHESLPDLIRIHSMSYLNMYKRALQLLPKIERLPQNGYRDHFLQDLRFILNPDTLEPYNEKLAIICSRLDLIKNSGNLGDAGIAGCCYQRDLLLAARQLLANNRVKAQSKIYFMYWMWEAAIFRNEVSEFLAIPGVINTLQRQDTNIDQGIETLRSLRGTKTQEYSNLVALEKYCRETKWTLVPPGIIRFSCNRQDEMCDITIIPLIETVVAENRWKTLIPGIVITHSDKTNYELLIAYDKWVMSL